MRLLQFEPSQLHPPSPHHASTLGPTRTRVRAVLGSKSAPTAPHEINLVAQPLAGYQEPAGVKHVGLAVAKEGTAGHGVGRLARPRSTQYTSFCVLL